MPYDDNKIEPTNTSTQTTAGEVKPQEQAAAKTNMSPLVLIEEIHAEQVKWNDEMYVSTSEKLFHLLARCYEVYQQLIASPSTVRQQFFDGYTLLGFGDRKGVHLTLKVVRYAFRLTNARAGVYARVLQIAKEQGKDSGDIVAWLRASGGVEAVRRTYTKGASPAELAKAAAASANNVLTTTEPLLELPTVPKSVKPSECSSYNYALGLIRYDYGTKKAHLIHGCAHETLIAQYLARVAKEVVEQDEAAKKAAKEQQHKIDTKAAIKAAVAEAVAI